MKKKKGKNSKRQKAKVKLTPEQIKSKYTLYFATIDYQNFIDKCILIDELKFTDPDEAANQAEIASYWLLEVLGYSLHSIPLITYQK